MGYLAGAAIGLVLCVAAFAAFSQGTTLFEYGLRGYECDSHAKMVERYTSEPYNERLAWFAVNSDNRAIFGFVSKDGDWTVLRQRPDGVSCVVGHGSGWTLMLGSDS